MNNKNIGSLEAIGINCENYNRYLFFRLSSDLDKLPHNVSSGSVAQCLDTKTAEWQKW